MAALKESLNQDDAYLSETKTRVFQLMGYSMAFGLGTNTPPSMNSKSTCQEPGKGIVNHYLYQNPVHPTIVLTLPPFKQNAMHGVSNLRLESVFYEFWRKISAVCLEISLISLSVEKKSFHRCSLTHGISLTYTSLKLTNCP